MHQFWKITVGIVGVVVLAAVGVALFAHWTSERKMNRILAVTPALIAVPQDEAALARGKYLYESRGCTDCHGRDGGGRTFIDDGAMVVRGPNITPGGIVAGYTESDWVRSIRHGVAPSGKPLLIMPSEDYARITDADLGAMIAYMRTLPAQPGDSRVLRLPLPVRFAYAVGIVRDAAEKIDHSLPPAQPAAAGDRLAAGAYAANMCLGCHGEGFRGGPIPGAPPDWPPAADLRPNGPMRSYPSAEVFAAMMRNGKRPDGSDIKVMPFDSLRELSDEELSAMHAFLQTLPAAN